MVLFSKFRPLLQTVLKPSEQLQSGRRLPIAGCEHDARRISVLVFKRWSSERRMRVMISEFQERKFFDMFVSEWRMRSSERFIVPFAALLLSARIGANVLRGVLR